VYGSADRDGARVREEFAPWPGARPHYVYGVCVYMCTAHNILRRGLTVVFKVAFR
jgi:hypothetical protein